jgi:formiminotetrahydrofolate cyclodeaminase
MAGSLAAMVASSSAGGPSVADGLEASAELLRRRAFALAAEDERVFAGVLASRKADDRVAVLREAANVPLRMVELSAELAPVLGELVSSGKKVLRGEALAGWRLLEAAAGAAGDLVCINAEELPRDEQEALRRALDAALARIADARPDELSAGTMSGPTPEEGP